MGFAGHRVACLLICACTIVTIIVQETLYLLKLIAAGGQQQQQRPGRPVWDWDGRLDVDLDFCFFERIPSLAFKRSFS